jgi:hypothetical protein
MLQTQVFVGQILLSWEKRWQLGPIENPDVGDVKLDVAGRHFAIFLARRSDVNGASQLDDEFVAELFNGVNDCLRRLGMHDRLGFSVTIPEINEFALPVISNRVDPAAQGYRFVSV